MTPSSDIPLDALLDKLVHEMSNEELAAYVKRCSVLRSSAQTRKATLTSTSDGGSKTKKKKSSVDQAMELLSKLQVKSTK